MKRRRRAGRKLARKQRTAKAQTAVKRSTVSKQTAFDPAKYAGGSDKDFVAAHVPRFREARPSYVAYEEFLKTVLKAACRKLAPLAIVEARAKGVASFAEKIIRKRGEYTKPPFPPPPDPLVRMTDLCGGRVVTQTAEQVQKVCRFIENAFDIDWPNSEDVSRRLRPTEFGYRSVHYIVGVNPEKLRDTGIDIPVPRKVMNLKAEIQVRTMLEHASADIAHDLLYKTDVKVPDRLRRMSAGLWAVLEGADEDFSRLVAEVEEFKTNYGAYHTRAEVETEIEKLRIVLSCDPENINLAVKIGQLALSIGKHELALSVLSPYAKAAHQGVERVRGTALTEMYWDTPRHQKYRQGRRLLEAACSHDRVDAETLCACAESWVRDNPAKARAIFQRAAGVDATEPVTLCRYIEFEVERSSSDVVVQLAAPMIRAAMSRARKQVEGRVNLPRAWSSLAELHLYVGEPFEAVRAVAQVIRLCDEPPADTKGGGDMPSRPCAAGRALNRLRETLKRIESIREKLAGYEWCERAVVIGLASRHNDTEAKRDARTLVSWKTGKRHITRLERIVIFSGACAPEMQPVMDAFKPLVLAACEGLSFTVFSGGTAMGISGIAGDAAEKSRGRIRAFGYMPSRLPRTAQEDRNTARFAENFSSPGKDFTPLDPLQGWTDMIAAGVDPRRVKLLAHASGEISKSECAIALALGARVGVVDLVKDKELLKNRGFDDADWQDHPNLVRLPKDPMTLRAFLLVDELPVKKAEFEKAAQKAHEEYVKSAKPKDPSLLPWKDLAEPLKVSCHHQVAYAVHILSTAGLGVRPLKGRRPLFNMRRALGEKGIRRLAEMEHGRWNVERLLLGWRYGEKKDVAKKISPYLIPWEDVPSDVQKFDIDGIESLPMKLREVGLEVYKL
jgi:ppGpp synthetase/RelA/SpoT-type nucleotidyltranferase